MNWGKSVCVVPRGFSPIGAEVELGERLRWRRDTARKACVFCEFGQSVKGLVFQKGLFENDPSFTRRVSLAV